MSRARIATIALCLVSLSTSYVQAANGIASQRNLIQVNATDSTIQTQPNDTLWRVAKSLQSGVSPTVHQIMVALFYHNPQAFDSGNLNTLKKNQKLSVPSKERILKFKHSHALELTQSHNKEWLAKQRQSKIKQIAKVRTRIESLPQKSAQEKTTTPSASETKQKSIPESFQSLESIAQKLGPFLKKSTEQIMVALYLDNIDEFIGGNMFGLQADKVLHIKDADQMNIIPQHQAQSIVTFHRDNWPEIAQAFQLHDSTQLDQAKFKHFAQIEPYVPEQLKKNQITSLLKNSPQIVPAKKSESVVSKAETNKGTKTAEFPPVIDVKPDETLWKIAGRLHQGGVPTKFQIMQGLLKRNPESFEQGNLNGLKPDVKQLNVPPKEFLIAIDRQAAYESTFTHNASWDKYRQQDIPQKKEIKTQEVNDNILAASIPEALPVEAYTVDINNADEFAEASSSATKTEPALTGFLASLNAHAESMRPQPRITPNKKPDIDIVAAQIKKQKPQYSLQQIMVSLYTQNINAFWGGNMFQLKRGYVIKLNNPEKLNTWTPEAAEKIVAEHKKTAPTISKIMKSPNISLAQSHEKLKQWQKYYIGQLKKAHKTTTVRAPTKRPAPAVERIPVPKAPESQWRTVTTTTSDTLWSIAAKVHKDSPPTIFQIMVGIFQSNKQAFWGQNIHGLKAQQTLKIPPYELFSRYNRTQSLQLIELHEKRWTAIAPIVENVQLSDAQKAAQIQSLLQAQASKPQQAPTKISTQTPTQQPAPSITKKKT